MKLILPFSLFFLLIINSSCQKYTVNKLPEDQIHFGEGGGITGAITEFCLIKNGQLFNKQHFTKDYKSYKKVKKSIAKKLFKTCKEININKIDLNNPGDRYFFIEYQTENSKHRIIWGREMDEVPQEVNNFYDALKAITIK